MTESVAKKKKIESVEEYVSKARATTQEVEEESQSSAVTRFADIETNPFYKTLLNPDLSPTEKKRLAAETLTFSEDSEQSREQLEAFIEFKEYLQYQRKRMAQQIIALTDTEAFSELQKVYQEINGSLLEFEKKIAPLTEIVDAVYTLRMNGVTFDAFREIAEEKEEEERLAEERSRLEGELDSLSRQMADLREQNAKLSQEKLFFGFGPIRQSAREDIAKNESRLAERQAELDALQLQIQKTLEVPKRDSILADFIEEKSKLRELLDISSVDHKNRQEKLVDSAQNFVNTTEERVASVLDHFVGMNGQIDRLSDANYSMREMYAILNDATKDALENNQEEREGLSRADESEGDIQKMQRDRSLREIENYISALSQSHVDTTGVFADLTSSEHRIKSMKDGNNQQISKTRALHTSGVASIADQLSTVLQAVSAAALGESSEMARMSLERMNQTTRDLSQKEVIRVALGTEEVNTELSKALSDLEQYGDVIRTATSITRKGLQQTKQLLGNLEDTARSVQEDVRESVGLAADVAAGKGGLRAAAKEEPVEVAPIADPFKLND